jgi:hypothetical protein
MGIGDFAALSEARVASGPAIGSPSGHRADEYPEMGSRQKELSMRCPPRPGIVQA